VQFRRREVPRGPSVDREAAFARAAGILGVTAVVKDQHVETETGQQINVIDAVIAIPAVAVKEEHKRPWFACRLLRLRVPAVQREAVFGRRLHVSECDFGELELGCAQRHCRRHCRIHQRALQRREHDQHGGVAANRDHEQPHGAASPGLPGGGRRPIHDGRIGWKHRNFSRSPPCGASDFASSSAADQGQRADTLSNRKRMSGC
jgi:hypothetical protein